MAMKKFFSIGEGTTIFFNGEAEIIFRKGIWNYEEAVLDISEFDTDLQETILKIFGALSNHITVTDEDLFSKFGLQPKNLERVLLLLDELSEQDYIINNESDNIKKLIKSLIGGTAATAHSGRQYTGSGTLFICDSAPVTEQLKAMSQSIGMNLTVMPQDDFERIAKTDLTSKLDALEYDELINNLTPIVTAYSCVLVCFQRPHIKFLRNLNRLLLKLSIPLVISMVDGPFLSVMTIKGYETGCFECYENRVMARLEDLAAYRTFVNNSGNYTRKYDNTYLTPILASIASFGLYDALLINTIHKAKLAGRVLNIYLPLIEIQVQDLLRVPFCSACGHIAKAQYEEMYTSSSKIVERLIANVELSNS